MFSLTKEQVRYFRDNLQIEFADVFSEEQIDAALIGLNQVKKKIASCEKEASSKGMVSLKKMLTTLPLEEEIFRKLLLNKPFAALCKELFEAPSLRFAGASFIMSETEDLFKTYPVACFSRDCNISPVIGGWILCLEPPQISSSSIWSMTPDQKGSVRAFRGDLTMDLSQIASSLGSYLLCLYTSKEGIVKKGDIDLWDPWLKSLGYVSGDPLRSQTHPLVAAP